MHHIREIFRPLKGMFFSVKTVTALGYVLIVLLAPHPLLAQQPSGTDLQDLGLTEAARNAGLTQNTNPLRGAEIGFYVGNVLKVVLGFLGVIFFLIILYAGLRWMTAEGNEETVNQAKSTLTQAVWGITIITVAYSITSFVVEKLSEAMNASF